MYRQGPPGEPSQQGRPNYQGTHPNYFNNPIYNKPTQHAGFKIQLYFIEWHFLKFQLKVSWIGLFTNSKGMTMALGLIMDMIMDVALGIRH